MTPQDSIETVWMSGYIEAVQGFDAEGREPTILVLREAYLKGHAAGTARVGEIIRMATMRGPHVCSNGMFAGMAKFDTIWRALVHASCSLVSEAPNHRSGMAAVLEANEDWNDFVELSELEPGKWCLHPGTTYWGDQPTIQVSPAWAARFPTEANAWEEYADGELCPQPDDAEK